MCWTMKPQFRGILAQAANLGQSVGNYTAEQFKAEYPQFCDADGNCHLPDAMLEEIVKMANVSIQPDKWLDSWHYAVGLYVAHYVTLQLRTYAENTATPAQAAASGALVGEVCHTGRQLRDLRHQCPDRRNRGLGRPERHHLWSDAGKPCPLYRCGRNFCDVRCTHELE